MKWKSDNGFTLVELLASIAILSVVILLAGSIHIFGQRQFISQTESASQANDLSYALSVMSRDLRKENANSVSIKDGDIYVGDNPLFTHSNTILRKNTEVLSDKVRDAQYEMLFDAEKNILGLTVVLVSTDNQLNQSKHYETTIYFRR